MIKFILCVFSLFFLSCCAHSYQPRVTLLDLDEDSVYHSTSCEKKKYTNTNMCYGPSILPWERTFNQEGKEEFIKSPTSWEQSAFWFLSTPKDKPDMTIAIRVELIDWAFLEMARDIDGKELSYDVLDRRVLDGYHVQETGMITLGKRYIEKYKNKDLEIMVSGKRGKQEISIPASYIRGFLRKWREK